MIWEPFEGRDHIMTKVQKAPLWVMNSKLYLKYCRQTLVLHSQEYIDKLKGIQKGAAKIMMML